MEKKIRFYNRDGRWYADLPEYIEAGGTEDECEMVAGADVWLDFLSDGKDNVQLKISDTTPFNEKLVLLNVEDVGAIYNVETYEGVTTNLSMWICPVTLFLFGEYPKIIYYE